MKTKTVNTKISNTKENMCCCSMCCMTRKNCIRTDALFCLDKGCYR